MVAESGQRDGHHASLMRHPVAELVAVGEPERTDVGGGEVRSLRRDHPQTELLQPGTEPVPLAREVGAEAVEVAVRQPQAHGHRLLERPTGHIRQVLTDHPHRSDEVGRTAGPPDLPACEGEGLPARTHCQRALPHPRQAGDRDVHVVVEPEVLVRLVGDHEEVVVDGERGDVLQLAAREDHAGGVVGGVQQQHRGPGCHRCAHRREVRTQGVCGQRYRDPLRSRQGDHGGVQVEVRVEDHDLVVRFDKRQDGGRDCLGRPGRHHHPLGRVDVQVVEATLVFADRGAQVGIPVRRRVLVAMTLDDCALGRFPDLPRPASVGEPLAQVDRAERCRQRGHLAEDRALVGTHALDQMGHGSILVLPVASRGTGEEDSQPWV